MAVQPEGIDALYAEVVSVKGNCSAGHRVGDKFRIGCWDTGGLCGFFYHDIFPTLGVMQFGGTYPWGSADELTLECPDRENAVTLKLSRPPIS
ncbi:TIGR04076 family protein [Thermodesulfobacteriota bacterium]